MKHGQESFQEAGHLHLLAEVALSLASIHDFDRQINGVLEKIGLFLQVSRTYIFSDNFDGSTTSNTHEWCNSGISPQKDKLQNFPYSAMPSFKQILASEGMLRSENTAGLPPDVREHMEPQNIQSLFIYPLNIRNRMEGFIGFDECAAPRAWKPVELELLKALAGIIANAFERRMIQEMFRSSDKNFRTFFETIDDIIIIGTLKGQIIHGNRALVTKLGYTLTELKSMHILDLHPRNKQEEAKAILGDMFTGKRDTCPLELEAKSGALVPVETRIWFGQWDGQECIFGVSKDLSREQAALQKFSKLFDSNPALMAITSLPERKFTDINIAFTEKLGYTREDILGKSSLDMNLFAQPEKQQELAESLNRTGSIRNLELDVRCKNGTVLHGLFSGEIIESQGERFFLTVMVDITEQITLQKKIEDQKERLANIIEGTRLGTWEWNVQTGETIFNERWTEIIGYTLDDISPVSIETWMKYAHPDDLNESEALLQKHFNGELDHYEFESRMMHRDGRLIWVLDRGKVIEWDAEGKPLKMFGTHWDITEKKALEETIRELSIRDPLTEIYNRRYILERLRGILEEYKREGRLFSLSMIDLDHFKNINDTYGHQAGDFILKSFTKMINKNIRPFDLPCRYGGEEFLVVTMSAGRDRAVSIMERILNEVRAGAYTFKDQAITFTFSCGITDCGEFEASALSIDAMIGLADARLYRAKQEGRNRIVAE